MRTAPKIALSLVISILLFSGLAVASYAGLFNVLETRFYQPAIIKSAEARLGTIASELEAWHAENGERFATFNAEDAVRRSLIPNQSIQDIRDREIIAGTLMAEMPGLVGIRIIDSGESSSTTAAAAEDTGKRRIHYSNFSEDILKRETFQIAYEYYGTKEGEIPFGVISRKDGDGPLVIAEATRDRFLYCFPFYDAYSTWRGTIVFYVSSRAALQRLVSKNLALISDQVTLVTGDGYGVSGTVLGMPQTGKSILSDAIVARWSRNDTTTDRVVSTEDSGWVLLTKPTGSYGFTGELLPETLFTFPESVRIFFLAISFLTLFLIVFLLFNLRQDPMIVAHNRIRRFQAQLIGDLIEKTDETRWDEIGKNLSYRKHDINEELKKGLGSHFSKKHEKDIDAMLDKSWEEILGAIGKQEQRRQTLPNADEIRRMLEQVLQNNAINLNLTGVPAVRAAEGPATAPRNAPPSPHEAEAAGDVEELDEVESVEEAEEIEEAESVEDLGEAEAVEELTEAEAVEEVEALEEIGTIEEAENAEEPAPIGETEQAETGDETLIVAQELAIEDFPEINVYSFDELKELDDYEEIETDTLFAERPVEPAEPGEVDYLDGEWEPDLLDVATDEELIDFIDEHIPDEILVFDFGEKPGFDDGDRDLAAEESESLPDTVDANAIDFSTLDQYDDEAEDATEVDYIESFLLRHESRMDADIRDEPIEGYLQVIGDEEPDELEDIEQSATGETGTGAIVNEDGLFVVSQKGADASGDKIDPDFKQLVDSVLS